jgi:hypothetical protein
MDYFATIDAAFTPAPMNSIRGPVATRKSQLGFHIDEKGNLVRDEDSLAQLKPKEEDMEPLTLQAKSCCNTYQAREELLKQLRDTIKTEKEKIDILQKAIGEVEKFNRVIRDTCYEDISGEMRGTYEKASNEYFRTIHDMISIQSKRHLDTIQASEETISKILVNQSELRRVIALAVKEVFPENPLLSAPIDCGICKVNPSAKVMVPCGHTGCDECTARLGNGEACYFCRSAVEKVIKLYLG